LIISNTLLKRASDGITESIDMAIAKNDSFEKSKKVTLEGFGEKISQHFVSRAVAVVNVFSCETILEPEITNVDMTRLGTSRSTAVGGKADDALVVLFQDVGGDGVSLGHKETANPKCIGEVIASSDEFSLSGAFRVDGLFFGFANEGTTTERDSATSVAAAVVVDGVRGIYPGGHATKVIGADSVGVVKCAVDVFEETAKFGQVLLGGARDANGKENSGKEKVHAATEGNVKELCHNAMENVSGGFGK
jgi:hypothetical protein